MPRDGDCLFRTRLKGQDGQEAWFHTSDTGADLAVPVVEAAHQTEEQALAWFAQLDEVDQHLRFIEGGGFIGAAPGSPVHLYSLGMIAHKAGRSELAASALRGFLTKTEGFSAEDSAPRAHAERALSDVDA